MRIFIASDHGGFYLKEELKSYLSRQGYRVEDIGNAAYDSGDDYTDFVFPLSEKVSKDKESFGIVLGRSGNGEAIAANKVKGVRATLCLNEKMARKAREDNFANVLAMGAEYVSAGLAKKVVHTFLKTYPSRATRHKRRVEKIKKYEASKH